MTRQDFVNTYYPSAVNAAQGSPIFPDTVITAAGLESNWNNSQLSAQYNNFFGMKKSKNWTGKIVSLPTKEVINGQEVTVYQDFKWYDNAQESFEDYVRLLQTPHYAAYGVTTSKDPVEQFQDIQAAGYATDPAYSSKLSTIYYNIKSFFPKTLH